MEDDLLDKFLEENGGKSDFLRAIDSNKIQIGRLYDISQRIPDEGTFLVISHYGTLANGVAGVPTPAADVIHECVRIIHKGLEKLQEDISAHEENVDSFSQEEVSKLQRTLAVLVYLAHRALTGLEANLVRREVLGIAPSGKKGKKAVGDIVDDGAFNWQNLRSMIIEDLLDLHRVPFERLWIDSEYGFSVPRLLIRTMCKSIGEPYLAKDNLQHGSDAFKILGVIAQRFGKKSEVFERLFPLMKSGEDVAKLVARAIEVFASDYELTDAAPVALKTAITLVDNTEKNATAEKGIATLIGDVCELNPTDVVVQGMNYMKRLQNAEGPQIRNAVLTGTACLFRWLNQTEVKGLGGRKMRKLIIEDILLLRCLDSNALVRSKAISLIAKLIDEKQMEPPEVALCMKMITSRLVDAAVLPRKYAAHVIDIIFGKFPAIVNQNLNFTEEVEQRRRKLLEVMLNKSPHKSYFIYALVREFADQVQQHPLPLPEEFVPVLERGMPSVRGVLCTLISEEKYWESCTLLYHAFEKYGLEAGITDAGAAAAIPTIYIGYFHSLDQSLASENNESQRSMLETSLDLSQSFSPGSDKRWVESEEVDAERKLLQFAKGCETMSGLVKNAVDHLIILMGSGTDNERTEVIKIIGNMVRCGYPITEELTECVITAITNVPDSASALLPAFWSIFIGEPTISNVPMIRNLFKILDTVSESVKYLLKPIIGEMYASEAFGKPATMILWDAFTRQYDCWSQQDARNAIFVLGAIGMRDKSVIVSNLQVLMDTGLGEQALEDMSLIKYTCEAIHFGLRRVKKGESDVKTTTRLKAENQIFEKLLNVLRHGVTYKGNWDTHKTFPKVAELIVHIIYRLCWDVPNVVTRLLQTIPQLVFGKGNHFPSESELKNTEEIYIRYLAIMTALLGTHMNYCDTVVMPELRRRKQLQQGTQKAGTSKPRVSTAANRSTVSRLSRNSSSVSNLGVSRANQSAVNQSTNEMDAMIGNAGFDSEQETVKNYIEKLLDKGTFQQFRRLAIYFGQKINVVQHIELKVAIIRAIAKLMLVSAESVLKLIDSFMRVWYVCKEPSVRIEVIKHMTILNVRFPNQMERCNTVLQTGLMSDVTEVKIACLDCMAFLALGDLVKVRDNIAEVALCLCDEGPMIRDMAKDFFNVCAEKDNVISNAVPEVISRLSNKEGVSQNEFQNIMKFLLTRVKKEKQVVGLVDTLVSRLKGAGQPDRLLQDTAFCLAQLPHTEKSFKILRENASNYSDKLDDLAVFRSFLAIVAALQKTITKPDLRGKIDDYEKELDEFHAQCVEKQRIAAAVGRQQGAKRRADKSGDQSSLMEDEQQENEEEAAVETGDEGAEDKEDEKVEVENEQPVVEKEVVEPQAGFSGGTKSRNGAAARRVTRSGANATVSVVKEEQEDSDDSDDFKPSPKGKSAMKPPPPPRRRCR